MPFFDQPLGHLNLGSHKDHLRKITPLKSLEVVATILKNGKLPFGR